MAVIIESAGKNLFLIRITGLLRKHELEEAQAVAAAEIERSGSVMLLIVLEQFDGWERGADWGDISFYASHGKHIERIAIVGDEKWRDEALMFAGAGLRETPVEYFAAGQIERARAWLV